MHERTLNAALVQMGTVGAARETFVDVASFGLEVGTVNDRFVGRLASALRQLETSTATNDRQPPALAANRQILQWNWRRCRYADIKLLPLSP